MAQSTAAIIGGDTLIGRELNELLVESRLAGEIRMISTDPGAVRLVVDPGDDEAAILAPLSPEALFGADAVFLAATSESSSKELEMTGAHGPPFIDVTAALEDSPRARLRAPMVEAAEDFPLDAIHVIAHPAAIALALFYNRIAPRYPISRAVVEIFEPVSARGQRGITELQKQAVSLLSFKPLPKQVFDAQLSFNMLPEYGAEAPEALSVFEQRIERHLATLLSKTSASPMPSLRLIQAPVFHGYSLSIWMEFEKNPGAEVLRHTLTGDGVDVRGDGEEAPHNVGAAGQSGIAIGNVRADHNNTRACWFWLVADNFRLQAENAVSVAKEFL
jgi:aspartate-semialdehyde dehydrogenase